VRSHRPALLIAIVLLAAPAAQAKVRNIPATLGDNLAKLTAATPLDVLLPETLAFGYGGKVYTSVSGGPKRWKAGFEGAPDCGGANACTLGYVIARKGAKHFNQHPVKLRGGVAGFFQPTSCGASCAPPSIEFKVAGVLYEIQAKVAQKGRTERQILIGAANSALAHGPR
jgi:hypothetical protein